jgi:hypothetical protein
MEYEESPRGRVIFNTKTKRFALYADRCILEQNLVVNQIMRAMSLPASQTKVGTDGHFGHYKCFKCLETSGTCEDDF